MKYLNDNGDTCYILNDYEDRTRVIEPAEYWVLNLLTIVLNDGKRSYLVLEYPSYSEVNSNEKKNDCIWSVPYMAYLVKKDGTQRNDTIADIKNFYEKKLQRKNSTFKELENYRFYHMGISNYSKHAGRSYIEYKRSARQPDRWKCYYINEYFINGIDHLGLLNLTDPEGLHSYRYFPLVKGEHTSATKEIIFLDKKLSSNITNLIVNSWNDLMLYQNQLSDDMLKYNENGLVVKFDIIGFTEIYHRIIDQFRTFDHSGNYYGSDFIASLAELFENHLKKNKIVQYTIEGDGVTATIPIKQECAYAKTLEIVAMVESIQSAINVLLNNLNTVVNLRCVMTYGPYIYGKLAGLTSLQKSASGDIMIKITRMDQGLKEYIKEITVTNNIFGISDTSIYNNLLTNSSMNLVSLGKMDMYRNTEINMQICTKGE